ncbi:hypothetical protein P7K49_009955 [Saguinus oedipus]|uniref:Uncharacterized protein n=1 Tax=Saguinus oedipus TaxID=9490 RepID=A0ABQ9VLG8_SAGOE|nr:hypothetical protein P7K49_009955 [Saguinus oedipus]
MAILQTESSHALSSYSLGLYHGIVRCQAFAETNTADARSPDHQNASDVSEYHMSTELRDK